MRATGCPESAAWRETDLLCNHLDNYLALANEKLYLTRPSYEIIPGLSAEGLRGVLKNQPQVYFLNTRIVQFSCITVCTVFLKLLKRVTYLKIQTLLNT